MKRLPQSVIPISATTIAGIALWLSRASLDLAGTTAAPIRVAMLPSLAELIGFVALALLVAAGMASLLGNGGSFWEPATDALLPLFTLSLLILPYLPWLADWIPALRLLAGPGTLLVWVVVIGQMLWIVLPPLIKRADAPSSVPKPSTGAALFGVIAVALSAPFVLNVRAAPATFTDVLNTIRRLPAATAFAIPGGGLGLLFDQEYGIVAYAPILLLGFVGIAGMLREKSNRRLGFMLAAVAAGLIGLPATVDPWWSRSMMPGRPVFLLLPLLAVPIGWVYARLGPDSRARAGAQALLLVSMAITLALVIFQPRVSALQDGDGSSALLQWLSPTWHVWREAPTYVAGFSGGATVRVVVWLSAFGLVAWWLAGRSDRSRGSAALAAALSGILMFLGVTTLSAIAAGGMATRFDVEGRVMFPLLETFDPVARPIAIRYDAFSQVPVDDLPPLFALSAVPNQRTDPQPVRVVLNARFRLPAGSYVLGLKGSEVADSVPDAALALQIGREGAPLETWPLMLGRGTRAQRDFDVPLDAEFVGFRAAPPVERAIAELRISPKHVVEKRRRLLAGTVLSAAAFEPARVFFHDSFSYAEPDGFWVKGRTTARMTLVKTRDSDPEILLTIHSGARPNVVTLATPKWSQTLELVPGVTQRAAVPSREGERFIQMTISTVDGFVPAEVESSGDRRLLGAWIALIPGDTARTSAIP